MVHCAVDSMLVSSPLSGNMILDRIANRVGKHAVARLQASETSWFQCRSQRLARRFELERERRARRHSSARAPRPQPPHPSTNMSPVTTRTSPRLKTASEDGPAKVRRAHAAAPASSPVARSPSLPGFRAGRARATDRARRRDRRDARASRWHLSLARTASRRLVFLPRAATRARSASRVSKRPPFCGSAPLTPSPSPSASALQTPAEFPARRGARGARRSPRPRRPPSPPSPRPRPPRPRSRGRKRRSRAGPTERASEKPAEPAAAPPPSRPPPAARRSRGGSSPFDTTRPPRRSRRACAEAAAELPLSVPVAVSATRGGRRPATQPGLAENAEAPAAPAAAGQGHRRRTSRLEAQGCSGGGGASRQRGVGGDAP